MASTAALNLNMHGTGNLRDHMMGVTRNLSLNNDTTRHHHPHHHPHLTTATGIGPLQPTTSTAEDSPCSATDMEEDGAPVPNQAAGYGSDSEDADLEPPTPYHVPQWPQSDTRHYQSAAEDFLNTAGGEDEAGALNNPWMQSPVGHRDHRTDSSADEDLSSKSKKRRKQSKPVRITNDDEIPVSTSSSSQLRSVKSGHNPENRHSLLFANPLASAVRTSTPKKHDRFTSASPFDNLPASPCHPSQASSTRCPHCETAVPLADFEQHLLDKHAAHFNLPLYGAAADDSRLLAQHLAYSTLFQQSGNLINSMKDPFGYPYSFSLASLMKDHKSLRMGESESSASLSGSPASSPNRPGQQQHPNHRAAQNSAEDGDETTTTPSRNTINAEVREAPEGDGDNNDEAYGVQQQLADHHEKLLPAMPNLLSFPAPNPFLFPFLNPNFPVSLTPVTAASSTHPGPPIRIFNPEAYCELCNKEFCNKYFLKTHKANKHGIYTDPPVTSSSTASLPSPYALSSSSRPVGTASPPPSTAPSHMSGGTILSTPNVYSSLGCPGTSNGAPGPVPPGNPPSVHATLPGLPGLPPTGPLVTAASTRCEAKSPPPIQSEMFPLWPASVSAASTVPLNTSLPNSLGKPPGTHNPDAFCELCQKEYCNKYFLKRHKARIHGIQPDPNTTSSQPQSGTKRKAQSVSGAETARIEESLLRSPLFNDLSRSSVHLDPSSNASFDSNGPVKDSTTHPPRTLTAPSALAAAAAAGKGGSASQGPESLKDSALANTVDSFSVEGNIRPFSIDHFMGSDNGDDKSEPSLDPIKPGDSSKDNLSLLKIPTPSLSHFSLANSNHGQNTSVVPTHSTSPNATAFPFHHPGDDVKRTPFSPEKLRQMGVINAEAFCEICCKEFCNKYFLRTHKYKKHGIGTPESAGSDRSPSKNGHGHGSGSGSGFNASTGEIIQSSPLNLTRLTEDQPPPLSNKTMKTEADHAKVHQLTDPSTDEDTKSTPTHALLLECDMCQRPFQSPYLLKMHRTYFHNAVTPEPNQDGLANYPPPPTAAPSHQAKSTTSEENDKQLSDADNNTVDKELPNTEISEDLQKLQSMIMELNNATNDDINKVQCKVCRRNIDKMYLATHMLTDHGVFLMDESFDATMASATNVDAKKDAATGKELALLGENQYAGLQPSSSQPTYCHLCKKDFFAFYFLQLHLQNYHGLPAAHSSAVAPAGLESPKSFLDRVKAEIDGKKMAGSAAGGVDLLQRRPSATPTRSYCEICNKELCNKYFMKTHMLKMHGINLESGAQLGGVTCDICHKELCSKYFLKVHKQNTHGIWEDQTNAIDLTTSEGLNPFFGQDDRKSETKNDYCPLCQRRFKSGKWLKGHLTTEHGERGKEEWRRIMSEPNRNKRQQQASQAPSQQPASMLPNANAHLNGPQVCRTCGQTFPEMVSLQVHIIKNHPECEAHSPMRSLPASPGALPQSSQGSGGAGVKEEFNHVSHQNPLENASKTYYCSFCPFNTPSLPYLFAHERTHQNKGNVPESFPSQSQSQSRDENHAEKWSTFRDNNTTALQCPICLQQIPVDIFQQHVLTHQFPQLLQNLLPFQALMAGGDPSKYLTHSQIPSAAAAVLLSGVGSDEAVAPSVIKKRAAKTFGCTKCPKKFPCRQNCLQHILTQHRPRIRQPGVTPNRSAPLQCKQCGFTSRYWSILRSHIRRLHYNKQTRSKTSPSSSPPLMPTSYAVPQSSNHFIMQAFLLAQPKSPTPPGAEQQEISVNVPLPELSASPSSLSETQSRNMSGGAPPTAENNATASREQNFVPSLVYLPVSRKISTPMSVTFNLTPA